MNLELRQTGRTSRLVEEAVQLAQGGRAVYMLVGTRNEVRLLQHKVDEAWHKVHKRHQHGIKVEAVSPKDCHQDFDWRTLRFRSAHPNCEFLLDHNLVEQRIALLQAEMKAIAIEIGKLYPKTV